jgi:hypothetical protein
LVFDHRLNLDTRARGKVEKEREKEERKPREARQGDRGL